MYDNCKSHISEVSESIDPMGIKAIERLLARSDVLIAQSKREGTQDSCNISLDAEILALTEEERNRQLETMVNSMKAVVQLVKDQNTQ
jgi:hypothetical protein